MEQPSRSQPRNVVAVLGTTASGKSSLAEHLARTFRGELINSDASAFYRELSTGVTKPGAEIRQEIPHHLLDVASLQDGYDLSVFLAAAEDALRDIANRTKLPIVVGGSGLYARALLDGYRPHSIDIPEEVRKEVRALHIDEALSRLFDLDPSAYQRIDQMNLRRIQRALELAMAVGGPVPPAQKTPREDLRIFRFYLIPTREVVRERIAARTLEMWDPWLEEVDLLEKKGLLRWLELRKPIGYRTVLAFIRGQMSHAEAIELIVRQTAKLAKKQRTWLRRETEHPFCHHFILDREEHWDEIPGVAEERLREFLGA